MKKPKLLPVLVKKTVTRGIGSLVKQVRDLVQSARLATVASIDTLQARTNYEIGRLIVEYEQQGARRAAYGKETLKHLSIKLTSEFGRGFSEDNLSHMRRFYLRWQDRVVQESHGRSISEKASRKFRSPGISFTLSWSHYVFLLGVRDDNERRFYEIEAMQNSWSLPELKRQFNTGLYERLALGRNKKRVLQLAKKGQLVVRPQDLIKNPYVLEFLGMDEIPAYSETELETAIIGKLQHFLLELGKGFLFEARQKRFTFDEEHFFVDLVFYNRLLRCYVLVDLKIGKLTHQDLGQMQMYVNHYDRKIKLADENRTIGIILCAKKHDALVEITLPRDANVFASEYRLYLPSKKELQKRLLEWTRSAP